MIDQGIVNFHVELIETLEDVTREELRMREQFHIRNTVCINEKRAFVTEDEQRDQIRDYKREYYQSNRERDREQKRKYYQLNRDRLNEQFECPCGSRFTRSGRSHHIKTRKHQDYVNSSESGSSTTED
jgi:hypothetical protein